MDVADLFAALLAFAFCGFYIFLIVISCKFLIKIPKHLERMAETNERATNALEYIAGAIARKEFRDNAERQTSQRNTAPQTIQQNQSPQ